MEGINTHKLISQLQKKKENPNFPLAPFKRLIKINSDAKNVSGEAAVKLQEIMYEFCTEIVGLANRIADISKRKTINAEMIEQAYKYIREKK